MNVWCLNGFQVLLLKPDADRRPDMTQLLADMLLALVLASNIRLVDFVVFWRGLFLLFRDRKNFIRMI